MSRHTFLVSNIASTLVIALLLALPASAGDWRQFRGTDHHGIAAGESLPVVWNNDHVAWNSPLPGRAACGPIVVGGRVYLTASSGVKQDRLHVVCCDATSGKQLWERQFWATGRTYCHPMSAIAAPTPCSDGKRIFAFFSSNDLICLDLDGNLLWYRGLAHDYPDAGNDVGMSSSPVVANNTVIVQIECQGDSFVAGVDADTGENRWRIDRKKAANWASPSVMRGETPERDLVLLQSGTDFAAHDPYTGEAVWKHPAGCSTVASAVAINDIVIVPSQGLTALRPKGKGEKPEVLWQENRLNPNSCSPLVYRDRVYAVNRTILVTGDAKTGVVKSQLRLAQGQYWATPVIVGDHLYVISYEGVAQTIQLPAGPQDEPKVVAKFDFKEQVLGTPAIADGAMFVRSDKHLWKITQRK